jgi:glucokinase
VVQFSYPVVVADIGGTNARFACVEKKGAPLSPVVKMLTTSQPGLEAAFREAVKQGGWAQPKSLLAGAAGPVKGRTIKLSNAAWEMDGASLARELGLEQGLLLNDFETLALSLPALDDHIVTIGEKLEPEEGGTRVVVGPGTGLGVGALAEVEGRFLPLASEGGHIGFPAETEYEQLIWTQLGYAYNPPEAETLLAGPGLPAFHQAVGRARTIWPKDLTTEEIIAAGVAKTDPLAEETLWRLLDYIARFCSDMALTFMATGGVYLAGGIPPRLREALNAEDFRTMFERNESLSELLATIPTHLVTAKYPALLGLAALAENPDRYMLNYRARLWR